MLWTVNGAVGTIEAVAIRVSSRILSFIIFSMTFECFELRAPTVAEQNSYRKETVRLLHNIEIRVLY